MVDVPAAGWRLIRVITVAPTINLLTSTLQARLTELYSERFSYVPPLPIEPIAWNRKTNDGANNVSRTILSVEVRGTGHIIGLSVKYLDGVVSRGSKDGGNHHTFTLNSGEHIVEMLGCDDGEWFRGMQFTTNTGRCSVICGPLGGIPVISRSKGGILAGFSTSSKKHAEWNYVMTGVRGIWRYDLMPRNPKENDVYSDYFEAGNKNWKGFNDRALIANLSSLCFSSVEVQPGDDIDNIQIS
ncbi:hypothetical protein B0J17DRAFT_411085 [Rhizoctonia solani]|nr:hypothetical protein B0J17DRAFT_411085 [Rhizoctonia solani]